MAEELFNRAPHKLIFRERLRQWDADQGRACIFDKLSIPNTGIADAVRGCGSLRPMANRWPPAVTPGSQGLFDAAHPQGFPLWIGITHYINLLFIILLIRSGLQILLDHPRLYWNVGCKPGTEWIRFTPVKLPPVELTENGVWTAKDDARYLSPMIGLPGGRHTLGMSRHWHFLSVLFWVGNGAVYIVLLFAMGQWRPVPTSWHILPDAWAVFVHYITFHLPPEPNTFYHYNALQQLSYFAVVFILAPLSILTGPSMSPALVNHLPGTRITRQSSDWQVYPFLTISWLCSLHHRACFHGGHQWLCEKYEPHRDRQDDSRLTGPYLGLSVLASWSQQMSLRTGIWKR